MPRCSRPFLVRYHYSLLMLFLVLASVIAFGPRSEGLNVSAQRALGMFMLCSTLWVTAHIPLQITSIIIALPSGLSFILPIGTPAMAIAYSSGLMTPNEFVRYGIILSFLSVLAFSVLARSYWPLPDF